MYTAVETNTKQKRIQACNRRDQRGLEHGAGRGSEVWSECVRDCRLWMGARLLFVNKCQRPSACRLRCSFFAFSSALERLRRGGRQEGDATRPRLKPPLPRHARHFLTYERLTWETCSLSVKEGRFE